VSLKGKENTAATLTHI